jgi:hypothetical protein
MNVVEPDRMSVSLITGEVTTARFSMVYGLFNISLNLSTEGNGMLGWLTDEIRGSGLADVASPVR